ncbi:hypothetical protein [Chryseolinea sp. H1M3-3]|uniref:hypothetical protein n=1 Tax=Chryseolinea sp. H1M3-3 TaxID=3034144 RepID=UPI0023EAB1DA|nr:hypothetical protein [Chryseolinea sp. H1M3-3]
MKQISGIYTIRDTPQPHYWDIVFEWEDELSSTLNVPLIPVGKRYDQIYKPGLFKKILNRLNAYQRCDQFFFSPEKYYVAFHIGPAGVYSFYTRNNVIPIIIDFWKHEDLRRLESVFAICPVVFVTSREVYDYLKEAGVKLTIELLSLSLPDKYFNQSDGLFRDIDIIQMGRSNATLDEFMTQYLKDYPATHYVCAKKTGNNVNIVSNKSGVLGVFKNREDFIGLLKRSKVSLVSAPGLDEDKVRTGGFAPVTPRFLESAACGCKLIGIYPDNADFNHYGIKEVCVSVKNYDQFKNILTSYLEAKTIPDHGAFLQKHLTSKRANEMLSKL